MSPSKIIVINNALIIVYNLFFFQLLIFLLDMFGFSFSPLIGLLISLSLSLTNIVTLFLMNDERENADKILVMSYVGFWINACLSIVLIIPSLVVLNNAKKLKAQYGS